MSNLYPQELPGSFKRFSVALTSGAPSAVIAGLEGGAVLYGVGCRAMAGDTTGTVTLRGVGGVGPVLPGFNGRTIAASGAAGADVVVLPCGIEVIGPVHLTLGGAFTTATIDVLAVPAAA